MSREGIHTPARGKKSCRRRAACSGPRPQRGSESVPAKLMESFGAQGPPLKHPPMGRKNQALAFRLGW